MSITIYKDEDANAIFIEDSNGAQFLNSLQATINDPVNGNCNVTDLVRNIEIISNTGYEEFLDESGNSYGSTDVEVCDALNAVFRSAGSENSGNIPIITSPLTANLVTGEVLNYELTADYGVGYEWDLSNVEGISTVEGNVRKLVGGSNLSANTYNIPVKAINYYGQDSQTLVLTVSNPVFSNSKSVQFNNYDWLGANAALLDAELGRASNGAGSGDAWTIQFWFKAGSNSSGGQTILYFGDNDTTNGGNLNLRFLGNNDTLRFQYGSLYNYLRWNGATNLLPAGTWKHVMITYDGGTTGASSGDINDYYSRFTIFVNGSDVTSGGSWSNGNYGWSSGIDADNLRVGRGSGGNYMRACRVDELAVWGSDQSANIASIYNGGTVHDLSLLGTSPDHWWRMGDGDTYPNLQDSGDTGGAIFVMYNMTVADIVSDVPS